MLFAWSAVNHCLFLLMISPAFEKVSSDVALDAWAYNLRFAQSTISGGASSCLLHQTSTIVELWSSNFFAASFFPISQFWRIISCSIFIKLCEYNLYKNFSMAGLFIVTLKAMLKQGYAQWLQSKRLSFLAPTETSLPLSLINTGAYKESFAANYTSLSLLMASSLLGICFLCS